MSGKLNFGVGNVGRGGELNGDVILEAACPLFRPGVDSSSEFSLGEWITENGYNNIINTPIRNPVEVADTGPIFQIWFLELGGRGICG